MTKKPLVIGLLFLCVALFAFPALLLRADTSAALRPVADGSQDSADWRNDAAVSCNAAECFQEVNDASGAECGGISDGDTSFIEASVAGAGETFDLNIGTIPDQATITQIDVTACAKRNSTSPGNKFQTRICLDGSCSDSGADIGVGGEYAAEVQSFSSLSVSKSAATDIEAGVVITGTNGKAVRVSSVSAVITYAPYVPPSGDSGTAAQGGGVVPRKAVFSGRAYDGGQVELLRKSFLDAVYAQTPLESAELSLGGFFSLTYSGLLGGDYLFALRAKDKDGREPGLLFFGASKLEQFSVTDILVPPTVELEHSALARGDDVRVFGYASPGNAVELEMDGRSAGEAVSDASGYYTVSFSTADASPGIHYVRAIQRDTLPEGAGARSGFSLPRAFKIFDRVPSAGDLNGDGTVNIKDVSIFLFRWSSSDGKLRESVDFSGDGVVDIADFSIFLTMIHI